MGRLARARTVFCGGVGEAGAVSGGDGGVLVGIGWSDDDEGGGAKGVVGGISRAKVAGGG